MYRGGDRLFNDIYEMLFEGHLEKYRGLIFAIVSTPKWPWHFWKEVYSGAWQSEGLVFTSERTSNHINDGALKCMKFGTEKLYSKSLELDDPPNSGNVKGRRRRYPCIL